MDKVGEEKLTKPLIDKKKKKVGSKIRKSKKLFDRWRLFRLLSAIIACAALFPASSDYETGWSSERTPTNCMINEDRSIAHRHLIMWLSFISILLHIPYKYYFLKWKRYMPKTFHELPSFQKLTLMQVFAMRKKPKLKDYLDGEVIPIAIFLLILPYPGLNWTFVVPQQILYKRVEICYFVAEPLYAIMFLRWIYLIVSLFNYGRYQNQVAIRHREKFGVPMSPAFSLKCYLNQYPLFMLFFFFIIPGILIFGSIMRIFERPMHVPTLDYDYAGNAYWGSIVTMLTVGYGDFYPVTTLGRFIVAMSCIYGGVILSFTFVSLGSVLQLQPNEKNALNRILLSSAATEAIASALSYNKSNIGNIEEKYHAWNTVRNSSKNFMEFKELVGSDKVEGEESVDNLKDRVIYLESKIGKLKVAAEGIIHKLSHI